MRNGFPWLTLGLAGLLFTVPNCGGDEGTGDDDTTKAVDTCEVCTTSGECRKPEACIALSGLEGAGVCAAVGSTNCCTEGNAICRTNLTGDPIEGGGGSSNAGRGGSGGGILGGSSGSTGKGGSSGQGGGLPPNDTQLGAACDSDSDCDDNRMVCLKELDGGSGIPKGLCTLPCVADDQCRAITEGSFCARIGTEEQLYCVEACFTGSDEANVPKCRSREEVACTIIGLGISEDPDTCDSSADCPGDELCSTMGECGIIVTGCVPTCNGDFDCDSGSCDFRSGLCNDDKPDDLLPIGAPCRVPAEGDDEPCDGFCVPLESGSRDGACEAFCVANASASGCGYEGVDTDDVAEAGCLFGTIISPPDPAGGRDVGPNDVMICGKLCDCNDDCPIDGEFCFDESENGDIEAIFKRKGYCRGLLSGEDESDSFDECPDGSSGGAGGAPGNAGAAGASGEGSSGEGGAPAGAGQGGQGGA